MSHDVEREFTVSCGQSDAQVKLLFRRSDPHAVVLRFYSVHGPKDWRVSRDTLRSGVMFRTAFDLACRVEPLGDSGQVRVSLVSEVSGHAVFDMCGAELLGAVDATGDVVPFDREHREHDWDAWLREASPR